ncbi:MAG: N-acetyltransferase family protein [Acholeplasmataceae bacterium]
MKRASFDDLEAIWDLRNEASALLRERGIDQWQYDDPSREVLANDIARGELYVIRDRAKRIAAMAAISTGSDPTYRTIHGGSWGTQAPYVTVHRLVVARSNLGQGLGLKAMLFAETCAKRSGTRALRVDTHPDNRFAIRLFNELGYTERGYILLPLSRGDRLRLAYDKTIEDD